MEDEVHPAKTISAAPSPTAHGDRADTGDQGSQPAEPVLGYSAHDAGVYDEREHDHAHHVCAVGEASVFGGQQPIFATLKHTAHSDLGLSTFFSLIDYTSIRARRFSEKHGELKRVFHASHITRIMFAAKIAEEHPLYYRAMLDEFEITEARNARSRRVALVASVARLCTVKAGEELGEAYEYTRLAEEVIGGFELCARRNVVVSFEDVDAVRSEVANVTSAELMKIGKEVIASEIVPPNPNPSAGRGRTGEHQEDAEVGIASGRGAPAAAPEDQCIQPENDPQLSSSPTEPDKSGLPSPHIDSRPELVTQERALAFASSVNSFAHRQACYRPILLFGLPGSDGDPIPIYREAAGADSSATCPSSDDLRRFAVLRNGGSGPPWLRG